MPKFEVPSQFLDIPYYGEIVPQPGAPFDLSRGANCQVYAYALLAHYGVSIPPLRSRELWRDEDATFRVDVFEPLDLLLFNKTFEPYGAHVAVYIADEFAVHLSKAVGRPAVWSLQDFLRHTDYQVLLGGKRPRRLPHAGPWSIS